MLCLSQAKKSQGCTNKGYLGQQNGNDERERPLKRGKYHVNIVIKGTKRLVCDVRYATKGK